MEVQDFASYALVIDARSRPEYEDNHIPGAIHVPASSAVRISGSERKGSHAPAEEAAVGQESELPADLVPYAQWLQPGDSVLVYCSRGGMDSEVWATPLRARGFTVDVLGGGWPNYRRWVEAGLEVLARVFTYKRLQPATNGGVGLELEGLRERGQQVLDLMSLAGQHKTSRGASPIATSPSQAAFETALLDALRHMDSDRDVWVADCVDALGSLHLPPALRDALQHAAVVRSGP